MVLWAERTRPKHSTRLSPFHLVYGVEAILPIEIMIPTSRIANMDTGGNDQALAQEKSIG